MSPPFQRDLGRERRLMMRLTMTDMTDTTDYRLIEIRRQMMMMIEDDDRDRDRLRQSEREQPYRRRWLLWCRTTQDSKSLHDGSMRLSLALQWRPQRVEQGLTTPIKDGLNEVQKAHEYVWLRGADTCNSTPQVIAQSTKLLRHAQGAHAYSL